MAAAESADVAPRVRHKSFTFRTGLTWTSGRSGLLGAEGKPDVQVSSPPEFKGEAGRWTPEDLFVSAVNACTMTTFAAFAQKLRLPVVGYRSEAEGFLEFEEDGYRFTRVVLRPRIVVADAASIELARRALHDAHSSCLIGRSVRARIDIEPVIVAAEA